MVGGEAEDGDEVRGLELGGEEDLVMELALSLEGARVHDLDGDGDGWNAVQGAREYRAEASLAEAVGEGVGGAAEDGVGETVGEGSGVRWDSGGGALATDDLPVKDDQNREDGERGDEGICRGGIGWGRWCWGLGRRDLAAWHGGDDFFGDGITKQSDDVS